jgi:L-iditol 2-dehydrogenase
MGLVLVQLARRRGVRAVFGSDLRADRRDRAATLGAVPLGADADGMAALHAQTDGRGADVVIVTPGSSAAVHAGIAAAAPGARVVCFTPLAPDEPLVIDQSALYFREVELLQSYSCGPDETRAALALLAAGGIDVASLVSHRVGLEGVADALRRAHDADGIKSIIYPHGV